MPAAAIPAITAGIGVAGAGSSAAQGKKASSAANDIAQQQLALQQQQFGLTKQLFGSGMSAFNPALNYWQALLKGGNAAIQATGPYASSISQAAQGSRNAIAATTPMGGEQNLATSQSYIDQANNIARLYAGMQPLAASQLGQLAGEAFGGASGFNPGANIGAATGAQLGLAGNAASAGQGYGGLIYQGLQKKRNKPTTGSTGTSPSSGGKVA